MIEMFPKLFDKYNYCILAAISIAYWEKQCHLYKNDLLQILEL